jgi:tetratricopeptide (TPR) repeat protein
MNSLGNEFAFDDNPIIRNNQAIQALDSLPGTLLAPYWPGENGQNLALWRPVATASYGLGWALWDGAPVGFHLVNVVLHGIVTGVVVLVLAELMPVAAAFVAGLFFAVHPVHVEAVANIVGRAEILSALLFLLACLLILRGGERLGAGRGLAVLLFYGLAFLTKESAVTLPGVVFLLDAARRDLTFGTLGPYLQRRGRLYLGFVLVAAAVLGARFLVLGNVARPFPPLGADILEGIPRIWTVAATWPHIVRLFFFPRDLVVDYAPAVIPIALGWNPANIVGVVMVLAILVLSLLMWRRGKVLAPGRTSDRVLGFGVLWFIITLSPTSNFFFLSGILLSERTLYLPSIGFVAVLGWAFLRLRGVRPGLAPVLVASALALLAVRSWIRTPTWRNDLEVFNTLITEHPESGRSQWILGDIYFGAGQRSEALRAYRVAIGLLGGHYSLMTELARKFMGAGYYDAAELLLTYAWKDRPEFGVAPGLLANVYDRQGRFDRVEEVTKLRLAEDSTDAVQYHLLSRALEAQGRFREAAQVRRNAIRHGEGDHWQQWGWLARLELAAGDTAAAQAAMDSARARVQDSEANRELDSLLVAPVGPWRAGQTPDSANISQNPTPGSDSYRK